jgi:hypothetical protein
MLGGSVSCGEGGRPAPTEPNKNQIDRRKVVPSGRIGPYIM